MGLACVDAGREALLLRPWLGNREASSVKKEEGRSHKTSNAGICYTAPNIRAHIAQTRLVVPCEGSQRILSQVKRQWVSAVT
jgi:hypothetical protein